MIGSPSMIWHKQQGDRHWWAQVLAPLGGHTGTCNNTALFPEPFLRNIYRQAGNSREEYCAHRLIERLQSCAINAEALRILDGHPYFASRCSDPLCSVMRHKGGNSLKERGTAI